MPDTYTDSLPTSDGVFSDPNGYSSSILDFINQSANVAKNVNSAVNEVQNGTSLPTVKPTTLTPQTVVGGPNSPLPPGVQQPTTQTNTGKWLMIGGGTLVVLVLILVIFKRKG